MEWQNEERMGIKLGKKDTAARSACDFGGGKVGTCKVPPSNLAGKSDENSVYGGEARISALRKLFPLMDDNKSLASDKERAEVEGKASLLAAVDYYVSMHTDICISAPPGNMHNAKFNLLIIRSFPDMDE
ncbi:hypothetical protein Tco_0763925 [Tanacetum coccineum]